MERRTILRRAGALGALALAGCVAGDDEQGDGPTTDEPTATPTPTPSPSPTPTTDPVGIVDRSISTTHTGCQSSDDQFNAAVSMDEEAGRVIVTGTLNTPNPCHEATLSSVSWDADAGQLAIDVSAVSTGEVCVECIGAVEYRATVTMNAGLPETVAITHDGTPVATGSDGGDADDGSESGGTGAAPRLVSSDLAVLGSNGTPADETGDIEFRQDALEVVVSGTVRARNGCERAELGAVEYTPETDELSVDVVAAVPPSAEDQACTQVISYIDYRATIRFENALPTTVSVSQDGAGGIAASHASASESAAPVGE